MRLLTGWHRIPARDGDEMLLSDEGWGYAASKCLSPWQAAAPVRISMFRSRDPAAPGR